MRLHRAIWRCTASTSATVRPANESSCVQVGGSRKVRPAEKSSSAASGVVQPARSDSVFCPSAR